jgi:hypothetical protein
MANQRPQLTEDNIRTLLALKHSEVTKEWLLANFAFVEGKQKIPFNGEFTLRSSDETASVIPKVTGSILTTAGRYVANLFLLGNAKYTSLFSFINEPWTKKTIGKINSVLSSALLEEKISSLDYTDFIDRETWFTYGITSFVSPGLSNDIYKEIPSVNALKKRLLQENAEAVKNVDVAVLNKIDDEVKSKFVDEIKDKPAYDYMASGSAKDVVGVTSAMRGLVNESKDNTKFRFADSSLQEGIKKSEIAIYADNGIGSACSRGIDTAMGGYVVKKFNMAFQHLRLDKHGTDCKTKYGLMVKIGPDAKDKYHLRYAEFAGKEYLLTEENIKALAGKVVKIRSPMFCTGKHICNKCIGEMYYRMIPSDTPRIGFMLMKIGSGLLNASLKNFHESKIKSKSLNLDDFLKKIE